MVFILKRYTLELQKASMIKDSLKISRDIIIEANIKYMRKTSWIFNSCLKCKVGWICFANDSYRDLCFRARH